MNKRIIKVKITHGIFDYKSFNEYRKNRWRTKELVEFHLSNWSGAKTGLPINRMYWLYLMQYYDVIDTTTQ